MHCSEVKTKISFFLSGELGEEPGEAIRLHLIQCEECQREFDIYRETWDLLGLWQDEEPDQGYIPRFLEKGSEKKSFGAFIHKKFFRKTGWISVLTGMFFLFLISAVSLQTVQINETERLLTALSIDEMEFIEYIDLVEHLEFLEHMEMFEDMTLFDEFETSTKTQILTEHKDKVDWIDGVDGEELLKHLDVDQKRRIKGQYQRFKNMQVEKRELLKQRWREFKNFSEDRQRLLKRRYRKWIFLSEERKESLTRCYETWQRL